MTKKAQVMLFVLIGLAIIIFFSFVFYLAKILPIFSQPMDPSHVGNFIEQSLTISAKHCLNKIGLQGGRYNPKNYLAQFFSKIEYAYDSGNKLITQGELKKEVEECIKDIMPMCINDFKIFKKQGIKIEHANLKPDIILAENDLPVSADYNVFFRTKDETHSIDKFKTEKMRIRLKRLHNIATTITEARKEQIKSSDFDLTYLGSIDTNTTILEQENRKQIYSLVDHKSSMDNRDYYFLFSNSFQK